MAENSATTKRTYNRLEFSEEEESQIINFVKQHEELFNPKHAMYKNKPRRDTLWNEIAQTIQKTSSFEYLTPSRMKKYILIFFHLGAECMKKWTNIRDGYNRAKMKKPGTGSASSSKSGRNENMAFLEEIITTNTRYAI